MSEAQTRRNSFDVVRVVAALAVAFGHQMDFAGLPEPALGSSGVSLSNTGLFAFFALSGYLVWRSLERDPRLRRFAMARLWRIYPGAMINTVACVMLGGAVTALAPHDYWTASETWSYLAHGLAIVVPPTRFTLPGVFGNARWPNVDTPIWTLKYEIVCYAVVYLLHRCIAAGLGAGPALATATCLLTAGTAWHLAHVPLPDIVDFYSGYNAFNLLRFGAVFCFGSLLAAAEGPEGEVWGLAARAAAVALATLATDPALNRIGHILLVALLAVEIGRSPLLFSARYRRFGDLSYGIYLYAYPVQSLAMSHSYDGSNFGWVTLGTAVVTVLLAYLSWRLVERPCLPSHRAIKSGS